ncbi:8-amino-7-oxononanoate synthase [Reinekea marinisedimentorum]|uniref:8-amino-7-oxononanoate synthase n=1 Tax=Reinekea marinisedimentorum TaxID=230495 RepID=A0A4R3HZL6_9GAMM|nr:8-amino-7-oxononanoate synthase [Reinekea marinisedimentorum]TCS38143.1 8-amino-7-oxononanoate synthase [Reinekea marinisedimentorum]
MRSFDDIPGWLAQRKQEHLLRSRNQLQSAQSTRPVINGKEVLSFTSNDYLGLANHPSIAAAMRAAAEQYGVGAGASHLVSGHHLEHELLEQELAALVDREAALVFSTGYMANIGVISALMSRRDTVLEDKLNHASLIDGVRLSGARSLRYRHNDTDHLAQQLERAQGKKLIVTDGVFSMDGDCANLCEMADIARASSAWLMVDDAHGIGVIGQCGGGLVHKLGLSSEQVPLIVGTLGKAFGTSGAFVAGDKSTIDYLMQVSRPYIYTTATPPAIAAASRAALKLVAGANAARTNLTERIQQFREGIKTLGYELMPSYTPIQPVVIGANEKAVSMSEQLLKRGILVTAIRPPTVPKGTSRLRVTLSAEHTADNVEYLLGVMEDLK